MERALTNPLFGQLGPDACDDQENPRVRVRGLHSVEKINRAAVRRIEIDNEQIGSGRSRGDLRFGQDGQQPCDKSARVSLARNQKRWTRHRIPQRG